MGRRENKLMPQTLDDDIVTFIVKLPLALRKTIKMLAARENVTINDFFIRSVEKEIADVVAKTRG